MKIRLTSDPNVSFAEADAVALWERHCRVSDWYPKGEIHHDADHGDGSEGPIIDATDMHEKFLREQWR